MAAERDLAGPTICPTSARVASRRDPSWLPRQRRGHTPQMIGRYPDYDVFDAAGDWDEATAHGRRGAPAHPTRPLRFFNAEEAPTLRAFCDVAIAQDCEPRVPVARDLVDDKLAAGRLDGYQYADMPDDPETWRLMLRRPRRDRRRAVWARVVRGVRYPEAGRRSSAT